MTEIFKPMLAKDADLTKLVFPLFCSAKLDGVRAVVRGGVVYSRSNKPIPNTFVQKKFKHLEHFDGELIFGDPTAKDCYRRTVSAVMSQSGTDGVDVSFFVFDHVGDVTKRYDERQLIMFDAARDANFDVVIHDQHMVDNLDDLLDMENDFLETGYEGLILRSPEAPYKMGRSTVKEGFLLKLKRFSDFESIVIGFEERQENTNEKQINELGRSKRSSHKAGKVGRGDLGALILRREDGVEFNCGTGFDDGTRQDIWDHQRKYLGMTAKVKSFDIGVKDKPRHPVFLGWRDTCDL